MAGKGRTPANHWVLLFEIQDHSREREVPSSKALRQEQAGRAGRMEGVEGTRGRFRTVLGVMGDVEFLVTAAALGDRIWFGFFKKAFQLLSRVWS